jgi:hypothetical protein
VCAPACAFWQKVFRSELIFSPVPWCVHAVPLNPSYCIARLQSSNKLKTHLQTIFIKENLLLTTCRLGKATSHVMLKVLEGRARTTRRCCAGWPIDTIQTNKQTMHPRCVAGKRCCKLWQNLITHWGIILWDWSCHCAC